MSLRVLTIFLLERIKIKCYWRIKNLARCLDPILNECLPNNQDYCSGRSLTERCQISELENTKNLYLILFSRKPFLLILPCLTWLKKWNNYICKRNQRSPLKARQRRNALIFQHQFVFKTFELLAVFIIFYKLTYLVYRELFVLNINCG